MNLILQLLDHELHRPKNGIVASPFMVETPAIPEFVPAIISSSHAGKFLIARKLTREGLLRSGVFKYDPDRIDELLPALLLEAYKFSVSEGFPNIFSTPLAAFEYIREASATDVHPHALLVPNSWSENRIKKFLGTVTKSKTDQIVYQEFCRVIPTNSLDIPVFFSRPDYVGRYTQFLGGNASLFLHNVKNGLSFVDIKSKM